MPPRLPAFPRLGSSTTLCLRPATQPSKPNFLPLVQTANLSLREKKRKAKQDPYAWAQAQQRKNANLKRKEELRREHDASWGDPVMGKTTPFLESLDSAGQARTSSSAAAAAEAPHELPTTPGMRNYFLTDEELEAATKHAYAMTKPVFGVLESQLDPTAQQLREREHEERHRRAVEALRRITTIENSSAADRRHANIRRVVAEFGRHNTDEFLKSKPPSIHPNTTPMPGRAGPDTGSSEVQIAILTTKIRALAQALQINRGHKDKANKRNLRLLVHRRQRLLKYMERKERGSERWTHMLEKLGLTPATWKKQIDL